jgi:hypothetical protein
VPHGTTSSATTPHRFRRVATSPPFFYSEIKTENKKTSSTIKLERKSRAFLCHNPPISPQTPNCAQITNNLTISFTEITKFLKPTHLNPKTCEQAQFNQL